MNNQIKRISLFFLLAFCLNSNAEKVASESEIELLIEDTQAEILQVLESLTLADLLSVYHGVSKMGVSKELSNEALKARIARMNDWTKDEVALVNAYFDLVRDGLLENLEHTLLGYVAKEPSKNSAIDLYALFLAYNQAIIRFPHKIFREYLPKEHANFFAAGGDAVEALTERCLPASWGEAFNASCLTGFDLNNHTDRFILKGHRLDITGLIRSGERSEKLTPWQLNMSRAYFPELFLLTLGTHDDFIKLYFLPAYQAAKIMLEEDAMFNLTPEEVFKKLGKALWARRDLPYMERRCTLRGDTEQVKRKCILSHRALELNPYTRSVKRLLLAKLNG